jgi:hypothetical protein
MLPRYATVWAVSHPIDDYAPEILLADSAGYMLRYLERIREELNETAEAPEYHVQLNEFDDIYLRTRLKDDRLF